MAWVSLDGTDEDPARFWTYIATALDRLHAGIGARALSRLRAPGADTLAAVDDLVNGLAAYAGEVVLALDDLHVIRDEACLAGLFRLVDRLPPTARILATARHDPPLRLGRLRANRLLGEVRASDLAFTPDEARALLVEQEGIPLGDDDIAGLVDRFEGWPAGLYLAALWLRGVDDPPEAVRTFGGSHGQVADYLAGEVLDVLEERQRDFLLQVAVLERFSAAMCDDVLERTDSAAMVAELERSNVFVVRLDGRREWFRFHHLFRDLLLLHQQRVDPSLPAAIRRRACAWCIEQGLVEEALEYAAAAGDAATSSPCCDSITSRSSGPRGSPRSSAGWREFPRRRSSTLRSWPARRPWRRGSCGGQRSSGAVSWPSPIVRGRNGPAPGRRMRQPSSGSRAAPGSRTTSERRSRAPRWP